MEALLGATGGCGRVVFLLGGGRGGVLMIGVTFCTVDGVDMKVHVLGTVNNKKR